jgi:hypothetical protein
MIPTPSPIYIKSSPTFIPSPQSQLMQLTMPSPTRKSPYTKPTKKKTTKIIKENLNLAPLNNNENELILEPLESPTKLFAKFFND